VYTIFCRLHDILDSPGASLPLDLSFDWADLELNGQRPAPEPVRLTGEVRNTAGVVRLRGELTATLRLRCDRCLEPFERAYALELEAVCGSDAEDSIPIVDKSIDAEGYARDMFILDTDMVALCDEDCPGLLQYLND
jgi:uncharacterized protein